MTDIPSTISTIRRADITRWRHTLIPTTRQAPADAESASHIWMVRAGCIRRLQAGIYDYLPLGWRAISKVSQIIREEMNAAKSAEIYLPAAVPIELFEQTGRADDYGDLLFRLTDRHGRVSALGPTHEEVLVEMVKASITSYKQLPLSLYQIQTKFRDEFRPRSGLLRGREFIMKDAYTFHLDIEGSGGLNETYDRLYQAYVNVFTRCGLDFSIVEAEAGPIGGSASHEFMVNADTGEDTILKCPVSGYAANVEKCEIGEREWTFEGAHVADLEKVHTPKMPGIDLVAEHLGIEPAQMLKTIVFVRTDAPQDAPEYVLAVVRGDHDVNEGKVRDAVGAPVALADEKLAKAAGFAIGYVSPRAVLPETRPADQLCKARLVIDPDAAQGAVDWATGADEPDHHVRHFNWQRELGQAVNNAAVADIRNAVAGDPSPRADAALFEQRGIEVGHIFKLGTKYSDAMGLDVMDKDQKRRSVIMGCYGIGVTRTVQACVEMSHDDNGIIWPMAIAPYHVHIVMMKPDDARQIETVESLSTDLAEAGFDCLIDDRPERPGVKFNDADIIGMPIRITIGDKALDQRSVEFKRRADQGKGDLVPLDAVVSRCLAEA